MINKFFVLLFSLLSASASASASASELIFNKKWSDRSGEHFLVMMKGKLKRTASEYLLVKQVTNNKQDWILNDYVIDCDNDIVLDVIDRSIEVRGGGSDGDSMVLFAYRIGCVGGIDPVSVKYFAYRDGVKYALRGEERIILEGESFGGDAPPVPGFNLKNNKDLYKYMLSQWEGISLREY